MAHSVVTYVQYDKFPSAMSSPYYREGPIKEVSDRDPSREARGADGSVQRFRYFSIATTDLKLNLGGIKNIQVQTPRFLESDIFYIDAELISINVVARLREESVEATGDSYIELETLLHGAKFCSLDTVIRCRNGQMRLPDLAYAFVSS